MTFCISKYVLFGLEGKRFPKKNAGGNGDFGRINGAVGWSRKFAPNRPELGVKRKLREVRAGGGQREGNHSK